MSLKKDPDSLIVILFAGLSIAVIAAVVGVTVLAQQWNRQANPDIRIEQVHHEAPEGGHH